MPSGGVHPIGFDIEVAYHSRSPRPDLAYAYHDSVSALARDCDVLIVVVPGGPPTVDLIDAPVLDQLGPNGILINIARGTVVNEAALINALDTNKILAAGLDVFAQEPYVPVDLLTMGNVVLTPHVGSGTHETRSAMSGLAIANLHAFLQGRGPLNPINDVVRSA